MSCISPRLIVNRRYAKIAGSSSNAEVLFRHAPDLYVRVDCGRCLPCQKKRSNYWRQRLIDEYVYMVQRDPSLKYKVYFVTLTFANSHYQRDISHAYESFRLFRERYRKMYGRSLRYWVCNEYGEKRGRLHLHALFFNPLCDVYTLRDLWSYGRVDMSVVGDSSKNPERDPRKGIIYVTKYITKTVDSWFIKWDDRSRIWCSPGIGLSYALDPDKRRWHSHCGNLFFRVDDSGKYPQALPRYYVDKMFSPVDKLRRSLNSLDLLTTLPPPPYVVGKLRFNTLESYYDFLSTIGGTAVLTPAQFAAAIPSVRSSYLKLINK